MLFPFSRLNNGRIGASIGNNRRNEESDVRGIKDSLSALGLFREEPRHGYITRDMDSAIKTFQRDSGLKIDGIMNPGGETETALRREIETRQEKEREGLRRLAEKSGLFSDRAAEEDEEGGDNGADIDEELPPLPPHKPEPPDSDEDESKQEKECSNYETALANAESMLSQREKALEAVQVQKESLEEQLSDIEQNIETQEAAARSINHSVQGMAVAAGVIGGGLLGFSVGKNPASARAGAHFGGEVGEVLSGGELIRMTLELKKLKSDRDSLEKNMEALQNQADQLGKAVEEAEGLVREAREALQNCQKVNN